ncbi:MAG: F0F1 ATP synthase subunit delta [Verrucomicrobiota bacterium]
MKINREARQNAKSLLKLCSENGVLQEAKVRQVVKAISDKKPRGYLAILTRFQKLIQIEVSRSTVTVESAVELSDKGASVFQSVESKFGPSSAKNYRVSPDLIGGVRITRGSDVWDGSVRARLNALKLNS